MTATTSPQHVPGDPNSHTDLSYEQRREAAASAAEMVEATLSRTP